LPLVKELVEPVPKRPEEPGVVDGAVLKRLEDGVADVPGGFPPNKPPAGAFPVLLPKKLGVDVPDPGLDPAPLNPPNSDCCGAPPVFCAPDELPPPKAPDVVGVDDWPKGEVVLGVEVGNRVLGWAGLFDCPKRFWPLFPPVGPLPKPLNAMIFVVENELCENGRLELALLGGERELAVGQIRI
jgi:hypothetical protein